ncbi:MAG: Gfo/Idh/MocA family oxidoreductase [Bacteroidota bacterium]
MTIIDRIGRRLRYSMIGGGPGAFIGEVHRKAAAMDGGMELVGGAFSSTPEKSAQQGQALGLDSDRVHGSFLELIEDEAGRPEDERVDFISIVTPNFMHYPAAKAAIEAGFHVVCDKPMTMTVEEAEDLARLVEAHGVVFALTHNYTGYPMVKQARHMVQSGELGTVRKIVAEYPQGWLATLIEADGQKQASWRTDPKRTGVSSAVGDIGSHAENLARYITGLEIEELMAEMTTFVDGRQLEDDANMLVRFEGGAKGVLYCSQISVGEENNLRIRVYGTEKSLEWHQEDPNYLIVRSNDGPVQTLKRGNGYLCEAAQHNTRLPAGHPESFIEAFANVYRNAGRTMAAQIAGTEPTALDLDFPTVHDGVVGVRFIHKAVESGERSAWVMMA